MEIKTSLVIATYNWPEALRLCLASVERQTVMPDEVVIADDGSGEETRKVVMSFKDKLPLLHVWHEDKGFRLTVIRNTAIAQCTGDYVIQIDGDIVLDRHYVEDMISEAAPGYYSCGSRAKLSPALSQMALRRKRFVPHWWMPGVRRRQNAQRMPWLSRFFYRYEHGRGCSMAFWRYDLLAVNGYDERIVGYGLEDTDLENRLMRLGIRKRYVKMKACQYHIHHDEHYEVQGHDYRFVLDDNDRACRVRVEKGIEKSL